MQIIMKLKPPNFEFTLIRKYHSNLYIQKYYAYIDIIKLSIEDIEVKAFYAMVILCISCVDTHDTRAYIYRQMYNMQHCSNL